MKDVLNLNEAAEYLRVSNQTVYNMIRDGRIKAHKVGREWRFLRADLVAYLSGGGSMQNDLIRRGELLAELERLETVCECPGIDFSELRKVVAKIPAVRPGAIAEAMIVENPDWHLYTEYRGDKPVGYRYGPEWVAMELYCEGGFKTPEEAKLRWLEYWEAHK